MFYKTKLCPNCHKSIEVMQPDRGPNYGSPLRICPFCGGNYVDNDFVELALKDPNKSFKKRSILGRSGSILITSIILFAIAMPATAFIVDAIGVTDFDLYNSTGWIYCVSLGLSAIIFWPTKTRMDKDSANLEEIWQASFRRLENPLYIRNLQNAGIPIPDAVYKKLSEKNEDSDTLQEQNSIVEGISNQKNSDLKTVDVVEKQKITSRSDNPVKNHQDINNVEIPADSLRLLKELYDTGVLTEEEFSKKKKQLLNL